MRVLVVADWFLKYAAQQAVGLAEAGAEVQLLCRSYLTEFGDSHAEWSACLGSVTEGTGRSPWVLRGQLKSARAAADALTIHRRIQRWHPTIVHTHPTASPWLLVAVPRTPIVMTVHDVKPHPGQPVRRMHSRAVTRAWWLRADGFVVHGDSLKRELFSQTGGRPIAVIPHGLHGLADVSTPDPVPEVITVLFFGRLEPYKGLPVLMDAMTLLWNTRPDVRLIVAGTGPCADQVLEDARVEKHIRYIREDELPGLLARASLVVAPYTEASQSGVVTQALAHGIPSIVTSVGELAMLVQQPGQVVTPGDPAMLAHALSQYLDHTFEFREHIFGQARLDFGWRSVGSTAIDFYKQILARQ